MINFGNPLGFEVLEQNMRENFRRIRVQCDVLLAKRVDELAKDLKGTHVMNDACRCANNQQIVTSVKIEPGSCRYALR